MKLKIITLCLVLLGTMLQAQREVETKENLASGEELYLNFKFAQDIKIVHGESNQVIVKASVNIDEGEGDAFFNIKTDKSSGQLKLYSDFGDYFKNNWKDKSRNNCNRTTEINYVVYVPKNSNLKIKSISGSVSTDNFQGTLITDLIAGDVTIKKYEGVLRLKTISGVLDVTVASAKLSAKSLTGTIYSDIDIKSEGLQNKHSAHNRVNITINNGNQSVSMETISGNIYIRKG